MSIRQVLREAIKAQVEGKVDPNDHIFTRSPAKGTRKDHGSQERDKHLYGKYPFKDLKHEKEEMKQGWEASS